MEKYYLQNAVYKKSHTIKTDIGSYKALKLFYLYDSPFIFRCLKIQTSFFSEKMAFFDIYVFNLQLIYNGIYIHLILQSPTTPHGLLSMYLRLHSLF